VIDYVFRRFPSGASERPWVLRTAVKSAGNRYAPLSAHTRIRSRRGHFSQPLGLGVLPTDVVNATDRGSVSD
jgi:hypothetical protein